MDHKTRKLRILFILKHRDYPYSDDCPYSNGELSSGLYNSARLVKEMLHDELGHTTEIVHVKDNNHIDREVHRFKPDVAVIEAYWVVPEKFEILTRLHPKVVWVVRNHSSVPFLALEGIVVDWSLRYMNYPNVILACNETRTDLEFANLIAVLKPTWDEKHIRTRCVLLPNYYPAKIHACSVEEEAFIDSKSHHMIDVACFGAIRPLKNQLMQAITAIEYARIKNLHLRFHINYSRVEQGGNPILRNLRALFKNISNHTLVEHGWLDHDAFLKLCRKMDLGMQVAFSETFNITTADLITNKIPVVTSSEIFWVDPKFYAEPTSSESIFNAMDRALRTQNAWKKNLQRLQTYDNWSVASYEDFLNSPAVRNIIS